MTPIPALSSSTLLSLQTGNTTLKAMGEILLALDFTTSLYGHKNIHLLVKLLRIYTFFVLQHKPYPPILFILLNPLSNGS